MTANSLRELSCILPEHERWERTFFAMVNTGAKSVGLPTVEWSDHLCAVARFRAACAARGAKRDPYDRKSEDILRLLYANRVSADWVLGSNYTFIGWLHPTAAGYVQSMGNSFRQQGATHLGVGIRTALSGNIIISIALAWLQNASS
jgi:hypothetical protein